MAPANPERGEHEIVLAGKTYRLRPSHSALSAIERETGQSTLALLRLGNAGELTLEQLGKVGVQLIHAGAEKQDTLTRALDAQRIEELIFEEGLPQAQARITMCLLDAATGGRTASGEAKAAPAKPSPDAGAA